VLDSMYLIKFGDKLNAKFNHKTKSAVV